MRYLIMSRVRIVAVIRCGKTGALVPDRKKVKGRKRHLLVDTNRFILVQGVYLNIQLSTDVFATRSRILSTVLFVGVSTNGLPIGKEIA
jgi:hypothetical protein